jgi:N-acetylmuramoyl-L-alanine amidase
VAEKKAEEKPKEAPKATPKVETKPAPAPQTASVSNVKNEAKPSASNPWHVIDVGGRDYITLESIRNFYNPLFGFTGFRQQGNHVWLMSNKLVIKASVGSQELLMNNMKFILSFPVISHGDKTLISRLDLVKLVDPILNPSHIQGAEYFDTVVVDAGHGGHDAGARGVYGYEKNFALKMAQHLRTALMARGFKVVLTRSTDSFISLSGRVSIANQIPNSIFISLHLNSGGSTASGIETWALTPQNAAATISRGGGYNASGTTGNKQDSANIALASAVQARVLSTVKVVDRGIKRAQWSVLTGIKKPGILFEGGFVTNAKECLLIASDSYQKTVAVAIADAVANYRKALEPAMVNRR